MVGLGLQAAANLLSQVVFGKLGGLHPELPQNVTGLVHRPRGTQVIGLAGDGRHDAYHCGAGWVGGSGPA